MQVRKVLSGQFLFYQAACLFQFSIPASGTVFPQHYTLIYMKLQPTDGRDIFACCHSTRSCTCLKKSPIDQFKWASKYNAMHVRKK